MTKKEKDEKIEKIRSQISELNNQLAKLYNIKTPEDQKYADSCKEKYKNKFVYDSDEDVFYYIKKVKNFSSYAEALTCEVICFCINNNGIFESDDYYIDNNTKLYLSAIKIISKEKIIKYIENNKAKRYKKLDIMIKKLKSIK